MPRDLTVQWNTRDERNLQRAIKELQKDVTGKSARNAVFFPARTYTKKAISRTKASGKAQMTPEAWWTDDSRFANIIPMRNSNRGFDKFSVASKRRHKYRIGGRGFAKQTWSPIARRLGITVKGRDDQQADVKAGRARKTVKGTSAKRRGIYADYIVKDRGAYPYIKLENWAPVIINQDRGSKGMPPRYIHKFGMKAAADNCRRMLEQAARKMARAWR